MKRIYFLIPNIEMTRNIVNELLLERVDERHIHILAKRGTDMGNLPEASYLQKSDLIPALEQGVSVGGFTGLMSGLVVWLIRVGRCWRVGQFLLLPLQVYSSEP